jgi:N-acetylglucosamine malate deacetylase 1
VKLNTIPTIALATALQRVVDRVRPEVVYMPAADDVNEDHRVMHHAGLVAVRPLPGSSVRRVLAYEIVTTARFGVHGFTPTVFVDITATLARKLEAMACYETELRSLPHPRSLEALELFARERGVSVGMGAAEHFQLVREML